MILNVIQWNNVAVATLIFLSIVLLLTLVLLLAKHYLVNSGEVAISINDGTKLLHAQAGKTLLAPPHSARTVSSCRRHAAAREAADNARSRYCREAERYCPPKQSIFPARR